jgi:glycosyltransferase involved in cell wall biosynthesis
MNKTINLHCPITSSTGYGISSYNIFRGLQQNGYNIHLFPIGNADVDSENDRQEIVRMLHETSMNWNKNNPCLKIWHQYDLSHRIGSGKYGSLIFFELNKLNKQEINMINNLDVVFVASKWGKTVLENNNITIPIVVSPLAVNSEIFKSTLSTNKDPNKYVFINIGKWEIRKGHDILVEAFNAAFNETDNVELWMLNHNFFLSSAEIKIWENLYTQSKLGSKIKILPRQKTHQDLAQIINLSDCGIFPARAEGWNNEILEVMAMNKPIITTNYSAHTEYCTAENSYLIDIDQLCAAKDDKFFTGNGEWEFLGRKQIEQMVEYMRLVYSKDIRNNPKGLETSKSYTWQNTAKIIGDSLYANS